MSWLPDLFGSAKTKEEIEKEIERRTPSETNGPSGDAQNESAATNETSTNPSAATTSDPECSYEKREVAAEWHVPLRGKLHKIEFEHGTTSGKRVLWIDQQEIFRRDWMFKLVGDDVFHLDNIRCVLRVDPAPGFKYKYSLFVDGKPLEQFKQRQAKALRIWEATVNEQEYRVVLEKDTLNIFLNGTLRDEEGEFVDEGTETKFEQDGNVFIITSRNSGEKRIGLLHSLTINGNEIEELVSTEQ